jgi:hypothetical protein
MTFSEFKQSLARPRPPTGLSPALAALWWAGKDDWGKAHGIVMDEGGKDCAWVHAYQRPVSNKPRDAEWDAMARALLDTQ